MHTSCQSDIIWLLGNEDADLFNGLIRQNKRLQTMVTAYN